MEFDLKLDLTEKDVRDAFEPRLNAALDATASRLEQRGRELAASRLKSGLKHWEKGFSVNKVEDGFFVISVTGKLATMMEDGIAVGEISKMIMAGNRAKVNKTGYVDVPIGINADSMGRVSSKRNTVQVSAFKDANSLMKAVSFSDYKNGGIKMEQRSIKRVKDIIESTEPKTGKASFLTIRRVTEDSVWPSSPYEGARILDDLDAEVEAIFNSIVEKLI